MRTTQIDYDEDENDNRILRDKGSLRVLMTFMDRQLHNDLVRRNPPRFTDALGRPAGQRPGYVFSVNDAASDARDAAWEERGRILQNAWRNATSQQDVAPQQDRSHPADVEAAWQERGRLLREAWKHA